MRELDSLGAWSSAGAYSRRSSRTERPLDDPVRDMEGMLVDEYGRFDFIQICHFRNICNIYVLSLSEIFIVAPAIQVFSFRDFVCPA